VCELLRLIARFHASSSLWPRVRVLLFCAKHLFVAARGWQNERHVIHCRLAFRRERRRAVVVERAALFGPRENDRHQRRVDGDQPRYGPGTCYFAPNICLVTPSGSAHRRAGRTRRPRSTTSWRRHEIPQRTRSAVVPLVRKKHLLLNASRKRPVVPPFGKKSRDINKRLDLF